MQAHGHEARAAVTCAVTSNNTGLYLHRVPVNQVTTHFDPCPWGWGACNDL
jgi:hypothetical protein